MHYWQKKCKQKSYPIWLKPSQVYQEVVFHHERFRITEPSVVFQKKKVYSPNLQIIRPLRTKYGLACGVAQHEAPHIPCSSSWLQITMNFCTHLLQPHNK